MTVPAWRVFFKAFRALGNYRIWVPLLAYFLLKILLVLFYTGSASGSLAAVWEFMLPEALRGAISSYPGHLLVMPVIMSRVGIAFDILVHVIFQGATIWLFAWALLRQPASLARAFRNTLARYTPVVGVTLFASVALYGVFLLPDVIASLSKDVPPLVWTGIMTVVGLIVQAFFIFTMPLVLLSKQSVLGAIRQGFSLTGRYFATTFALVTIPFLLTVPTLLLEAKSEILVARLSPDILIHVEIAKEFVQWLSTLLLIGGVTVFFIDRRGSDAVR